MYIVNKKVIIFKSDLKSLILIFNFYHNLVLQINSIEFYIFPNQTKEQPNVVCRLSSGFVVALIWVKTKFSTFHLRIKISPLLKLKINTFDFEGKLFD